MPAVKGKVVCHGCFESWIFDDKPPRKGCCWCHDEVVDLRKQAAFLERYGRRRTQADIYFNTPGAR